MFLQTATREQKKLKIRLAPVHGSLTSIKGDLLCTTCDFDGSRRIRPSFVLQAKKDRRKVIGTNIESNR
jgi:hypothetical protein